MKEKHLNFPKHPETLKTVKNSQRYNQINIKNNSYYTNHYKKYWYLDNYVCLLQAEWAATTWRVPKKRKEKDPKFSKHPETLKTVKN